ncbi:MAG: Ig domain-containing protein [Halobacteriota archaeon]
MTTGASASEGVVEDWNVTFDGGNDDVATSVQQTSDNGYIVAGYTNNSVSNDMWLVKTDEKGLEIWNVTFECGVSENAIEIEYSVQQISDGYIVAGTTKTVGDKDMWLVKVNDTGSELWNVTFDSGSSDYATDVQQTSDNGYILTGYTYSGENWDIWLVKTYANGTEQWNKTFDSGYNDFSRSILQTSEGYIITGSTNNSENYDIWLVKTYANGTEQWNKTFDSGNQDHAYSACQTYDKGYAIAGFAYVNDFDMWLVKTDDTGFEEWNITFDGGVEDDEAYSVQQTSDEGYIIAGYTENNVNRDMWLVKTDDTGFEEWNITFDGVVGGSNGHDYGYFVQQTSDGYILAGSTFNGENNDMWLIKVKENKAPVLTSIGDKSVNENKPLTFTINANDPNSGDILTYTSDNLPTGATLNNSTGVFSWTPSASQVGIYSVGFNVSDGTLNDSEVINITVNNVKSGGSSGGVGNPVIISNQEETEEEEDNTSSDSSDSDSEDLTVSEDKSFEEEVEDLSESQVETEVTSKSGMLPVIGIILVIGALLSMYIVYRRKD